MKATIKNLILFSRVGKKITSTCEKAGLWPTCLDGWRRREIQKVYLPNGVVPTDISIVLGSAPCIHSCLFCPQSIEKPREKHWLDLEVLDKVLNELPEKGLMINVSSYSETMLNPIMLPALRMMKEIRPNLPIILATNGSMITEDLVRQLIDTGLDIIQVSFDAPDRQSYKELMQSDNFDKVARNLQMVCDIRNATGSPMKIYTHIMGFERNMKNFKVFKKHWQGKVDEVILRRVGNWGSEGAVLKDILREKGFIPVYQKPERRYPCTSISMHIKLMHDGCYYPCVAYIPNRCDKRQSLGDAREISFQEAWENLDRMRKDHLCGNWGKWPFCETCDVWGMWENMFFKCENGFSLEKP